MVLADEATRPPRWALRGYDRSEEERVLSGPEQVGQDGIDDDDVESHSDECGHSSQRHDEYGWRHRGPPQGPRDGPVCAVVKQRPECVRDVRELRGLAWRLCTIDYVYVLRPAVHQPVQPRQPYSPQL